MENPDDKGGCILSEVLQAIHQTYGSVLSAIVCIEYIPENLFSKVLIAKVNSMIGVLQETLKELLRTVLPKGLPNELKDIENIDILRLSSLLPLYSRRFAVLTKAEERLVELANINNQIQWLTDLKECSQGIEID